MAYSVKTFNLQYPQPNKNLCTKYHKVGSSSSKLNTLNIDNYTVLLVIKTYVHTLVIPQLFSTRHPNYLWRLVFHFWWLTHSLRLHSLAFLSLNFVYILAFRLVLNLQKITKHSASLKMTYQVNVLCYRQFSHSLPLSASLEYLLFASESQSEECHSSSFCIRDKQTVWG